MVELIDSIGLERLDNGAHFAYHSNTLANAKANATISERCAKVLTPYDAAFVVLDKALKTSQKSMLTDAIAQNDELRDTLYMSYKQMVEQMVGIAIPEMAEAAKILNQHIKDYRINVKAQLDKETGLLQNFIADLQEKYAEQVETLSLTALVTKMQAANEKVNELIQQRADEYAMRTVGATKQARVKVDEAYRNLILVINAYMLMEDDNEDYIAFAKHQNEEIKRIKQQVLGQTSGNKKPDEGGDEPTPEPTHEITAFYPKERANPDKPLEFPRNKPAVLEGKGLKLVDSPEGKKAQLVLINYVEQRMPHEDSALLLNTDEKIEFTMMYDAAEGQYNFQIETYPNGTEEAVIIQYPETITLV